MENVFSFRRFGYAVAALVVVVASGALGYHAALDETWLQSVYRSVVTVSLTGLDSVPRNDESRCDADEIHCAPPPPAGGAAFLRRKISIG